MSEIAIRVEGLSKQYRIGQREQYRALRDVLAGMIRAPFSARSARRGSESSLIWALRDVSFEVARGEAIGIIGRNGAGKSTLLKILSRVTEPTSGHAMLFGRVGSLLEVGTGFHPELTGRENIYLNGIILGMRKAEIDRKFDEIVAFSEVERFLDTPVKRYSSGMYVRLAFAVAAHLEPEILIVDEVLAVGDAAFQQKCLGKMGDIAGQGRTVLFVSHNMEAVQRLCSRAIWIHNGQVMAHGSSVEVVSRYLHTSQASLHERVWPDRADAPGTSLVRLHAARVRPANGVPGERITVRTPAVIEFEYWHLVAGAHLVLNIYLYNEQGVLICNIGALPTATELLTSLPTGLWRDVCHIPGDLLNDGVHRVTLAINNYQEQIYEYEDILVFDVQDSADLRGPWYGKWEGAVRPMLQWDSDPVALDPEPVVGPAQPVAEVADGEVG